MSSSPHIRLKDVSLAWGESLLVDRLNIDIPASSFTCLLGPSGIGKSTLLRFIAGLPGPVVVTGEVCADDGAPLTDRVAWMPQTPSLLPWLTVIENVVIGPKLRGRPLEPEIDRARSVLARVGLCDAIEKYPHQLSGGMQNRTALARTLIEDKPIILMDEPFASVDAITRNRLQAMAVEMLSGRTVVLVTHDPFEALRVGDRIHVLNGQPATMTDALIPESPTPRDSNDTQLSQLHARLMHQLGDGG